MARKAMLIDESKCTACRGCQVACKQWNDLDGWGYSKTTNAAAMRTLPAFPRRPGRGSNLPNMREPDGFRWLFLKEGCMHCGDPACVDVCPTKALKQQPDGRVTLEPDLCNGCGYCSQFCPFGVPKLEVSGVFSGKGQGLQMHLLPGPHG